MATKDITPKQYAKWYGCSYQYIQKCIAAQKPLPHVLKIKEWSRFYTLEVPETLNADSFKEVEQIYEAPKKRGRKPMKSL